MLGLFKKKKPGGKQLDAILADLCQLYETFSCEITGLYNEFPDANPAEQRFFAVSATSVFVQVFGKIQTNDMHELIDRFTEQCVAGMLFYMPKADYTRVHNACVARFGEYANLIIDVHNSQSSLELQNANFALITKMDCHFLVDRDAIERSIAGLELPLLLTNYAVSVSKAAAG
jgi:hypothetical protein